MSADQTKGDGLHIFSLTWFYKSDAKDQQQETSSVSKHFREAIDKYAKDYVYQGERCPTTGSTHVQGYINTKEKTRAKTLAKKLSAIGLPGITVKTASTRGREALKTYCMKKESRIWGPIGLRDIYMAEDLPKLDDFWPVQQFCYQLVMGPVSKKKVHWIYDQEGQCGKTDFAKYMAYHHKSVYLPYATTQNIINIVAEAGPNKVYIFNLTRSKPKDISGDDLYSAMESVSDGFVVNTKWKAKSILFNPPHVLVFANCLPKMDALSKGRFIIHEVKNKAI